MKEELTEIFAAKLNSGVVNYWLGGEKTYLSVGDYAIAENKDGYDLVQIVARIETTEASAIQHFTRGYALKKIVRKVYDMPEEAYGKTDL